MNYGFTGTRSGMTRRQCAALQLFLTEQVGFEFHHGRCVGADFQAWAIVDRLQADTIAHPSDNEDLTAETRDYSTRPRKPPLERNHDIVDECDILIAAPKTLREELRSGTWATIRYARKTGVPVVILDP